MSTDQVYRKRQPVFPLSEYFRSARACARHTLLLEPLDLSLKHRDSFSRVLDYLRDGVPAVIDIKDEELLERVRRDFDYFCLPDVFEDNRSWLEKLGDSEYTVNVLLSRPRVQWIRGRGQ